MGAAPGGGGALFVIVPGDMGTFAVVVYRDGSGPLTRAHNWRSVHRICV